MRAIPKTQQVLKMSPSQKSHSHLKNPPPEEASRNNLLLMGLLTKKIKHFPGSARFTNTGNHTQMHPELLRMGPSFNAGRTCSQAWCWQHGGGFMQDPIFCCKDIWLILPAPLLPAELSSIMAACHSTPKQNKAQPPLSL